MTTETTMTLEEYKAAFDKDAEDCGACSHDEDLCMFHAGFEAGAKELGRIVVGLVADPDLCNDVSLRLRVRQ